MAGRLLDAGYSLCVYDTQSEATKPLVARGARLAKSPAEVASSAEIVLASLPTPDIVKAVTLGPDGIIAGNRATILHRSVDHRARRRQVDRRRIRTQEPDAGRCAGQRRHQGRGERHAGGDGVLPEGNL